MILQSNSFCHKIVRLCRFLLEKENLSIAIIAASFGLGGTLFGSLVTSQNSISLEEDKFNSQLILKALEEKNKEKIIDLLRFYVETGVMAADAGFIEKLNKYKDNNFNVKSNQVVGSQKQKTKLNFKVTKNTLQIGQLLETALSCSENCYFKIYHINSELTARRIYPLAGEENYLKKNEVFFLPGIEAVFPYGYDMLVAVSSPEQFTDLNDNTAIQYSKISIEELAQRGVPKSGVDNIDFSVQSFAIIP